METVRRCSLWLLAAQVPLGIHTGDDFGEASAPVSADRRTARDGAANNRAMAKARPPIDLSRLLRILGAVCLVLVFVGNFWYAIGGLRSMVIGLGASLLYGTMLGAFHGGRYGFDHGVRIGILGGLAVGVITGMLGIIFPERLTGPVLFGRGDVAGVVFALNLAIALVRIAADQGWALRWRQSISLGATNGALVSGVAVLHALLVSIKFGRWSLGTAAAEFAFGTAIGAITAPVAESLAFWLRPRLRVFVALLPYLRELSVPLGGFAFGYLMLIFVFATFIGAAWRNDPSQAYVGLPVQPRFGSFFYLSVETVTGIGYAGAAPHCRTREPWPALR